jgi:ABC-type uncharacterized transport system permease subunit
LLLPLIAVACYLIGAVLLGFAAYRGETDPGRGGRMAGLGIAFVGVVVQAASLLEQHRLEPATALSTADTAAIVGLVIAAIAVVVSRAPRRAGIAALLLAIAVVLEGGFSDGARRFAVGHAGREVAFHVAVATTAFALLTIGAVLAVAQALVDRRLRARKPLGWLRILTPLESLESGTFQSIAAGFALLTLALLSGAVFIEDLFAQHLVHKVTLAIVAWVIFGVLLLGRVRFGWRGRQALRWTLSGYAALALSYFGSKLVLEYVFGQHWG